VVPTYGSDPFYDAFVGLGPTAANDLFSLGEIQQMGPSILRQAERLADGVDHSKAGRRAEVAYQAVKLMQAIKEARLGASA
jgi:hypothetical protein